MIKVLKLIVILFIITTNICTMQQFHDPQLELSINEMINPLFNAKKIPSSLSKTIAQEIIFFLISNDKQFENLSLNEMQLKKIADNLAIEILKIIADYKSRKDSRMSIDDKIKLANIAIYNKALTLLQNKQNQTEKNFSSLDLTPEKSTNNSPDLNMLSAKNYESLERSSQDLTESDSDLEILNSSSTSSVKNLDKEIIPLEEQLNQLLQKTKRTIEEIQNMQTPESFDLTVNKKEYFEAISKKIDHLLLTIQPTIAVVIKTYSNLFEKLNVFYNSEPEEQNKTKQNLFNFIKILNNALDVLLDLKKENLFKSNYIYHEINQPTIDDIKTNENPIDFYSSIEFFNKQLAKNESLIISAKIFITNAHTINNNLSELLKIATKILEKQRFLNLKTESKDYENLVKTIANINNYNKEVVHQEANAQLKTVDEKVTVDKEKINKLIEQYEQQRKNQKQTKQKVLRQEIQDYEKELEEIEDLKKLHVLLQNSDHSSLEKITVSFNELLTLAKNFYSKNSKDISETISLLSVAIQNLLNSTTIKDSNDLKTVLFDQFKIILIYQRILQLENQNLHDSIPSPTEQNRLPGSLKENANLLSNYKKTTTKIHAEIDQIIKNIQLYFEMIHETLVIINEQQSIVEKEVTTIDTYDLEKINRNKIFISQIKENLTEILLFEKLLSEKLSKIQTLQQTSSLEIKSFEDKKNKLSQDQEQLEVQKNQENDEKNNAIKTMQRVGKNYIAQKQLKKEKQKQETAQNQKEAKSSQLPQNQEAKNLLLKIEKQKNEILNILKTAINEQENFQEKTSALKETVESHIPEIEKNIEDLTLLNQEEIKFLKKISQNEKNHQVTFQTLKTKRDNVLGSIVIIGKTKQNFKSLTISYNKTIAIKPLELLEKEIEEYKKLAEEYVLAAHGKKDKVFFAEFNSFLKNIVYEFNQAIIATKSKYEELEKTYKTLLTKERSLNEFEEKEKNIFEECKEAIKNLSATNTATLFKEIAGAGLTKEDIDNASIENLNPLSPQTEEQRSYEIKIKHAKELAIQKAEELLTDASVEESKKIQENIIRQEKKAKGLKIHKEKRAKSDKKIEELEAQLKAEKQAAKEEKDNQEKQKSEFLEFESKKAKHLESFNETLDNMLNEKNKLFTDSTKAAFKKNQDETASAYQKEIEYLTQKHSQDQKKQAAEFEQRLKEQQEEINKIQHDTQQTIDAAKRDANRIIAQQKQEAQIKTTALETRLQKAQEDAQAQQEAFEKARKQDNQNAAQIAQQKEDEAVATIKKLQNEIFIAHQELQQNTLKAEEQITNISKEAHHAQEKALAQIQDKLNQRITTLEKELEKAQQLNATTKFKLQKALEEQKDLHNQTNTELKEKINETIQKAQQQNAISQNNIEQLQAALVATQKEKDTAQQAAKNLTIQKDLAKIAHETELAKLKKEQQDLQQKQAAHFEQQLKLQKEEIERIKKDAQQAVQATKEDANKIITQQKQDAQIKTTKLEAQLQIAQKEAQAQQKAFEKARKQDNQNAAQIAQQKEDEALATIEKLQNEIAHIQQEKEDIIIQNSNHITEIEQLAYNQKQEAIALLQQTTTQRIIDLQKSLQNAENNSKKIQDALQKALDQQTKKHKTMTAELKTQIDQAVHNAQKQKEIAQENISKLNAALIAAQKEKDFAIHTSQELKKQQEQENTHHAQYKKDLANFESKKRKHLEDLDNISDDMFKASDDLFIASTKAAFEKEKQENAEAYQINLDQLAYEYMQEQEKQKVEFELQLKEQQERIGQIQYEAEQKIEKIISDAQQTIAQKEHDANIKIGNINDQLLKAQYKFIEQESAYKKAFEQNNTQSQRSAQEKEKNFQNKINELMNQIKEIEKEKNDASLKIQDEIFKQQQDSILSQKKAMEKIQQQADQKIEEYYKQLQEAEKTAIEEKQRLQKALEEQSKTYQETNDHLKIKIEKAVQEAEKKESLAKIKIAVLQKQIETIQQEYDQITNALQELSQIQTETKFAHDAEIKRLKKEHTAIENERIKQSEKQLADLREELKRTTEANNSQTQQPKKQTRSTSTQADTISDEKSKKLLMGALDLAEYLTKNQISINLTDQALELAAML